MVASVITYVIGEVFKMTFEEHLNKQLKDPEFYKEYIDIVYRYGHKIRLYI